MAPRAVRYPALLDELADGVRAGLSAGANSIPKVVARLATSSAPSAIAAAAEHLVTEERVNVVLAYANPTQARLLGDLAENHGVPVVVVDPGAHVVTSGDDEPRVLAHSLGHWQSIWALAHWSVGGVGTSAFVISSLYDSGFDGPSAFAHGYERAGGTIAGSSVTHVRPGDIASAVEASVDSEADALFVAASGREAEDILRAIAADRKARRLAVLLPGLASVALGVADGLGAITAVTWPASGKSPFASLGEDVGALVAAAVEGGESAVPHGTQQFAGERGDLVVDLRTGRADVPITIMRVSSAGGRVIWKPVGVTSNTAVASAFADEIPPMPRTGWLDVYGAQL